MTLINEKELYFFGNNIASKASAKVIMKVFGLKKINKLYKELYDKRGRELTGNYFEKLNTTYQVSDKEMVNIPQTGPLIIISNHPSGTFDGLLLIDLFTKVRPDIKFMGNMFLSRIEPLKDYFIEVNPFNPKSAKNISGIRASLEHIKSGGALVIFPAGEISTYRYPFGRIQDKKWSESVIKFIKKSEAAVLPVYIDANNSKIFHLMGKIHPLLRTAMIPRETTNKKDMQVSVRIGSVISPNKKNIADDIELLGKYLRGNVYCLNEYVPGRKNRKKAIKAINETLTYIDLNDIAPAVNRELLIDELQKIESEKLFDHGSFSVYFTSSDKIPHLMKEIGRMREITFREVGEGTNNTIDTDNYDNYYHQLFIWDNAENAIVGAYRVGLGQEVIEKYGITGFYTNSLFRLANGMEDIMRHTIELGRSFVVKEYQRKPASLMLLWKGILYVLLKNESYNYLMGPVTMSGKLSNTSKTLLINYLRRNCFDYSLSRYVKPIVGLRGLKMRKFNYKQIEGIDTLDYIDKLILDTERRDMGVPILLKKYLQLNGKILGFNIDRNFNDSIDALLLLNLNLIPEKKIIMLSKELNIDVMSRFRDVCQTQEESIVKDEIKSNL